MWHNLRGARDTGAKMSKSDLAWWSDQRDTTAVYTVAGKLFGSPAGYALQEEIRQKVAGGQRRLILDLESVQRIDSSGVGILVAIIWSTTQAGGNVVLATVPPAVEKVLGLTMLLGHVDHAPTVAEAIQTLERLEAAS